MMRTRRIDPMRNMDSSRMRALQAGFAYFGIVFGTGFVLGAIRVPFLVPRLGERWAELAEMPVMALVIVVAARWVVGRFALMGAEARCGVAGGIALLLMVGAELLLAVVIADRPLGAYLAGRDPVSGGVYVAMLFVFAAMPWFVARRRARAGVS